jgi:hypothetical protein
MNPESLAHLGDPDLRIGGLKVWIHGREFPEAVDYWDSNWLTVTACYRTEGSWVIAAGSFIHCSELSQLLEELENLYSSLKGTATLPTMEPNLKVRLNGNGRGGIELAVSITPNHLIQTHDFHGQIDQTDLPPIIASCRGILATYPIKGQADSVEEKRPISNEREN